MAVNVMITSAGAGPAVAVIKALKMQQELDVKICAVDADPLSAGFYLSDSFHSVPLADSVDFLAAVLDICEKEQIDFIIPIFDKETPFFARNRKIFDECRTRILVNSLDVVEISNDKLRAYQFCLENGILAPRVYSKEELEEDKVKFPLVVKPRCGIGTKGVFYLRTKSDLNALNGRIGEDCLVQEYVDGIEYTVDSISDFDGNVLAAVPRQRIVVKAGQSVKAKTVGDEDLVEYGKQIAEKFRIKGPGCSQFKVRNGEKYFIEMNPRYGTGISLTVAAGINMPLIHLKLAMGKEIKQSELEFKKNLVMLRYWEEIFLNETDGSYVNCRL